MMSGARVAAPEKSFLPDGQNTGAPGEGLDGNDRQQPEVQKPQPRDADDPPAAPSAERDDDETRDVESDDAQMQEQNDLGDKHLIACGEEHGGVAWRG
jgi:hypothetical protein